MFSHLVFKFKTLGVSFFFLFLFYFLTANYKVHVWSQQEVTVVHVLVPELAPRLPSPDARPPGSLVPPRPEAAALPGELLLYPSRLADARDVRNSPCAAH